MVKQRLFVRCMYDPSVNKSLLVNSRKRNQLIVLNSSQIVVRDHAIRLKEILAVTLHSGFSIIAKYYLTFVRCKPTRRHYLPNVNYSIMDVLVLREH